MVARVGGPSGTVGVECGDLRLRVFFPNFSKPDMSHSLWRGCAPIGAVVGFDVDSIVATMISLIATETT
jgi:hypothetical protein